MKTIYPDINHKYTVNGVCFFIEKLNAGGCELFIWNKNKKILVWKSARNIGVNISPEGDYLAVEDWFGGHDLNAVLVFWINGKQKIDLVFQTEYPPRGNFIWFVNKWKKTNVVILTQKSPRSARLNKNYNYIIHHNAIKQNIY